MNITIKQLRENAKKTNERNIFEVIIEYIEKKMLEQSLDGKYKYRYVIGTKRSKQEEMLLVRKIQDYFRDKEFQVCFKEDYDEDETVESIIISWY